MNILAMTHFVLFIEWALYLVNLILKITNIHNTTFMTACESGVEIMFCNYTGHTHGRLSNNFKSVLMLSGQKSKEV